jgi:hypothetical protein
MKDGAAIKPLQVTLFPDTAAASLTTENLEFWELRDRILTTAADCKKQLPLLKLAVFGNQRTKSNCLRFDANVVEITGVAGDYDGEQMDYDTAVARLRQAGLHFLIYTSPRHTPNAPRWRVLVPTSSPLPPTEHSKLVARLNGVLGGVLANESFTLSQSYYYGKINGSGNARCDYYVNTDYIDQLADLDAAATHRRTRVDHFTLTDVPGVRPTEPIVSLDDARLMLPDDIRHMIVTATPPADKPHLKDGRGHCYVVGYLVRHGLSNAQIKAVYRLGRIQDGPAHISSRGFDGYLDRTIAFCRQCEKAKVESVGAEQSGVVLVRASDVVIRPHDWLWIGHLLRGALELLTGIPGLGKSQVHCSMVACATTGRPWPDGTGLTEPVNVIMVTAEDTRDQDITPRLMASGADLNRVLFLKCIKTDHKRRQFLLAEDLDLIERAIRKVGQVGLITIDPITAFMGGKIDSHKTTEVRSQLGPLKDFTERTNVAVSAITHPAKNPGRNAIDHFIASQAFIAAARIGHVCIKEMAIDEATGENKPTGRILFANAKNNPSVIMPTLAYRVVSTDIGPDSHGQVIATSHVVWENEPVNITADAAVAAMSGSGSKDEVQAEIRKFLQGMLTGDEPVPAKKIFEEGKSLGFSEKQIRTAARKLRVAMDKSDFKGGWVWSLPQSPF